MKRQLSSVILYSIMVYLTLFMLNSAFPEVCQVGDVLAPGESCTYPGTDTEFSVLNDGSGQFGFFTSGSALNIKNTTINGVVYTLVAKKLASGSWEIEEIADSGTIPPPTNTAPTFTDGSSTTRSVAENTAAGAHIGTAIAATDADNDTLTYTLSGADAASFEIDATTGQLKTKGALDYETKRSYTVTVSVSDGNLTDTIAVTVNVTDVAENSAPVFTEGASTTRTVALPPKPENPGDMDIGVPLFATDADGDYLTYTLGGTDAALFHTYAFVTYLDYTTPGVQLTTRGGSLYDGTKSSYTVTLTVSDGSLTDTITVTITVTDVVETPANRAPIFTSGSTTTRAIAENTAAGLHIGTPVAATDADSDTLTYTLGGTDAASFGIDATTGQLKTKAPLDYETKSTYTVTVSVSDGSLTDTITVTINVTDVVETPANRAPAFTEGTSTTRSVAENTAAGAHIGAVIAATDADNDTLTYTLGGTDAASFEIDATTGQLKTKAALDYETKSTYTVTVTVSDGSLTDTITVTITVTDVAETPATTGICQVGDVLAPGESCTYPDTDTEFAVLSSGRGQFGFFTSGSSLNIRNTTINGVVYTLVAKKLASGSWEIEEIAASGTTPTPTNNAPTFTDGSSTVRSVAENTAPGEHIGTAIAATDADNDTLTYTLGGTDAASFGIDATTGQLKTKAALDYETKSTYTVTVTVSDGSLTDTIIVTINLTDVNETLTDTGICQVGDVLAPGESCTYPDTDATFSVLNNGHAQWNIPNLPSWLRWANQVSIGGSLSFTATINSTDYHFVAEEVPNDSWEIKEIGDDSPQQPETPEQPEQPQQPTPRLTASTTSSLTEATLDGSVVTLTLSGGTYERSSFSVARAITVSGIDGVTFRSWDVDRISDTEVTVELTFNGDFDTNATLTVTVGADAIAGYDGSALTAQIPVTGGTESIVASTTAPLTEATLHESVVTLTLSGRTYVDSSFSVARAIEVSGIDGVTFNTWDVDRISDTEVTVELTFDGNINTDATLTVTVGAGAIAGYGGSAFTAQIPVTSGSESLAASTAAPLTEATLHESVVTLTLSGRVYEDSSYTVGRAITVSGIDGVTFRSWDVDRISDTEVTVELTFNGDFDTNATLTFTVSADAIAGYGGSAFTAQIPVTSGSESLAASTAAPLTEATLHESVVTLTLSGRVYEDSSYTVGRAITVSGIDGVTFRSWDVDRISDTEVTVELTFNGDFDTNATLTFTVSADAIAGYGGSAFTAQIPVTGLLLPTSRRW